MSSHCYASSNPISDLYPVVHDLSDVEYAADGCGWADTFGNFEFSDLAFPVSVPGPSLLHNICPRTAGIDDRRCSDPHHQQENKPLSRMTTPIKRNGHHNHQQRKGSSATQVIDAAEGDGHEHFAGPSATHHHPLQPPVVTPNKSQNGLDSSLSRRNARLSRYTNTEDDDDVDPTKRPGDEMQPEPPRKKKSSSSSSKATKHLRQRSRQFMNMFLSRSNSMGSSTREISTTESCTETASSVNQDNPAGAAATPAHKTFSECYILTRKVFNCRSSEIWECLDRETGIRYCVKIFECPTRNDYHEMDMLEFLTRQQHQYEYTAPMSELVGVFEEVHPQTDETKLYIVMELATGGNLLSKVVQDGPMDEQVVKRMTRSILEGCQFLHSRQLVHADIQPENVLLRGGQDDALLADFGSTVNLAVHDPFGSRTFSKYAAPEVLQAVEPYAEPADMWSVGCMVYFMLTGASPFDEATPISRRKTMTKIGRAEFSFPKHVSRTAKQFMANLIAVDQSVRMTAEEALDHPWLRVEDDCSAPSQSSGSFFRRNSLNGSNQCGDQGSSGHRRNSSMGNSSSHHRRNSSLGSQNGGRSIAESVSPTRKNSKTKHHRRLSSLTKGLTKLFSPKQDPALAVPPTDLFSSSTLSSTDHDDDLPPRTLGRTRMPDTSNSSHRPRHRRMPTK